MKNLTISLICGLIIIFKIEAQSGFTSITNLDPVPVSTDTGEKPQAKVWSYAGKHWAVLPNSSGTHLWRLDGKTWTNILLLSTKTSSKADCKMLGNAAHILLFQGASSQLVSVEYSEEFGTYQLWSKRTSTVGLNLKTSTETATIDMDGTGRMWLAYDGTSDINVKWSDSPYHIWSSPITLANTVNTDDISAVISLPGKVGVFWSDQNAKRFGFKTHTDGANPTSWSSNEVPASQSAQNYSDGMADDHLNLAVASDGTLYCAVKTGYDSGGYPTIALLIRRPSGNWDDLYSVSGRGTRPIVLLNEELNKVRIIYPEQNGGGVIYYRESSTTNISFGEEYKLIDGYNNNPTSTKDRFNTEVVVLASNNNYASGVLASESTGSFELKPPLLSSPTNLSNNISTEPTLSWESSDAADKYEVHISENTNFTTIVWQQNGIESTFVPVSGLVNNITYYWRVRANTNEQQSKWSSTWSFTTTLEPSTVVNAPELSFPKDLSTGVSVRPALVWNSSVGADSYRAQVSRTTDFSITVFDQSAIVDTSTFVSGLANNTNYYWRVLATNSAGDSDWSATWSFTTTTAPSTATLVAHWKMDEGSGTMLSDASEYVNNASIIGDPTWITGVDGQALRFNGTSQYATSPDNASLDITNAITIATWIRPEKTGTQYMIKKAGQNGVDGYELSLSSSGKVFFRFNQETSGNSYRLDSQISYPNDGNTWMHVAATYDGAVIRIYIDGVENSTKAVSSSPLIIINELPLTIGSGENGYRGFQGAMDEIYLYNAALSSSEINELATFSSKPTVVSAPVLSSPADLSTGVSVTPTLGWNSSVGANSYRAQVSTTIDFSTTVFDQGAIINTSTFVSGLANSTDYYWRVVATNSDGDSDWSTIWSFTTADSPVAVAVPDLLSPNNAETGVAKPTNLSWSPAEGAETYSVQVSEKSNFSNPVFNQTGIVETSVLVSSLADVTTYYWRVRVVNVNGQSDWSTIWSFTTASDTTVISAPVLSSPADLSTGVSVTPTLGWNSSLGADYYRAQVSTTTDFSTTVFDQSVIEDTSAFVSGLGNSTDYYWRVLATNSAGDSDWSTIWSFTTASVTTVVSAPLLRSPADLSTGVSVTPTLGWNASEGATSYDAQVSTTTNFSTTVFSQNNISGTSVSVSGLAENTAYYWRVRATNTAGDSDWSTIWSFTTISPSSTATLVGHWKMEEGSGTMLSDASEYGNNALVNGNASWVPGVDGMAIQFNGNQYASAENSSSLNFTQAITIAAWIIPETRGNQILVRKTDNSGANGFELSLSPNGRISFQVNQTSNKFFSKTNYPTNGNTWMHIAATFDGSIMKIFINGVENSSKTISLSTLSLNNSPLLLGAADGGSTSYRGAMDEVYIYSVALQDSEISDLRTGNPSIRLASNSTKIFNYKTREPNLEIDEFKEEFFAYPNPFSLELLSVSFSLSEDSAYTLTLFDNRGAKITDLQNGKVLAGELNTIEVDGSWLPTGLYLVRLQTDKGQTKTIRLVRR